MERNCHLIHFQTIYANARRPMNVAQLFGTYLMFNFRFVSNLANQRLGSVDSFH